MITKEQIANHINDAEALEQLYRKNKSAFKKSFETVYPTFETNPAARCWKARLNYSSDSLQWGSKEELSYIIISALVASIFMNLGRYIDVSEEFYFGKNIALIILPFIIGYLAWIKKLNTKSSLVIAAIGLCSTLFINLLPNDVNSDTLILSCIHLPLFLWFIMGYVFINKDIKSTKTRISFLKFNGELIVTTAIIVAAGILLVGLTVAVLSMVLGSVPDQIMTTIVLSGLSSAPIVATYLIHNNSDLVKKVPSIIAKVFSPLVLISLIAVILSLIFTNKNPYEDREFLLVINLLLIGVLAIILFSIADTSDKNKSRFQVYILTAISSLSCIIELIALSAILYRIFDMGFTPNRIAVMGGNILIMIHLILINYQLFRLTSNHSGMDKLHHSMVVYLPVYALWTIIMTFVLPFIFSFQ